MPSVTQQEPMVCTSKKRRREEDDSAEPEENRHAYNSAVQYKITTTTSLPRQHHYHAADRAILMTSSGQLLHQDEHTHNALFARKTLVPLQTATKRLRMDGEPADGDHNLSRDQHRRIIAAAQVRQPKVAHISSISFHEALQQTSHSSRPYPPARTTSAPAPATSTLAPCHICQRRPTKKSDLDSFADCEGCGMRTCYVCIRECLGWDREEHDHVDPSSMPMEDVDERGAANCMGGNEDNGSSRTWPRPGTWGHRQMVCSRCCVEEGVDGDVICLGCLQR
ncbi:uncharacterized protein PgNI_03919 [Pyricularia grisea]|uniref:Uncharacterized protein n=1 Tax=Pyricularia grisea TaxID=148305 RepID=A0A6P8B875_PYRGI|nr:uncharacterized protein PgNI_03919 [Pyricularia grisea]TLD12074.1 hypothetical protein PgNI_03919 [Pyricularia grisea]